MKKRLLLLFVIYAAFIALGLPDALLGSGWNQVRSDLGVSLSSLGLMTVLVYIATMLSTFNAPRLIRLLKTKRMTFISILFTGVSLILMSQVTEFYQLLFFAIPLGMGAGAIDVSLNHYLSMHYEAKHMNYLHSFYGIGVTLGPSIMAYQLKAHSWRGAYLIVGGILVFIALLIWASFPLWHKESKAEVEDSHKSFKVRDILKTKGALESILIFLFYVHLESLAGVWIASYFYIEKGVSISLAAVFTTVYYLVFTVGRLTAGFLSSRIRAQALVTIGLVLMISGALMMFVKTDATWYYFLVVGLFGFGCAPVFPNMMFINSLHFEKEKLSKIISLQMGVGYMGFGLLTPLAGLLFDKLGINLFPYLLVLVAFIITLLYVRFLQKTKVILE